MASLLLLLLGVALVGAFCYLLWPPAALLWAGVAALAAAWDLRPSTGPVTGPDGP